MRTTRLVAACFILIGGSASADTFAAHDGVWFGTQDTLTASGALTAQLGYTFRARGDFALLTVRDRKAEPAVDRQCTYAVRLSGGASTETAAAFDNSSDCPASVTMSFAAPAQGVLPVTVADFSADPVSLDGVRRPHQSVPPQPEGFDVLGVSTRQTRAEIEANLIGQRGWDMIDGPVPWDDMFIVGRLNPFEFESGDGKYAQTVLYVADSAQKEEERRVGKEPRVTYGDAILVAYEPRATLEAAKGDDTRATGITRFSSYTVLGQVVSDDALRASIDAKYGPFERQDGLAPDGERYFDLAGAQILGLRGRDHECTFRNAPRISAFASVTAAAVDSGYREALTTCGVRSKINIDVDPNDGTVRSLEISLRDDPFVTNLSMAESAVRLRAQIEGLFSDAASQTTPEL